MLRRYTFKLYPTAAQEAALLQHARLCAMLWNALLEMRETHYRRAKQRGDKKTSLTAYDQGKELTKLNQAAKADQTLAEWRLLSSKVKERVAGDLDNAFKAFFRRAKAGAGAQSGYPRFKSVRHADAIPMREAKAGGWKFEPVGTSWRLSLFGVPGRIKARGKFPSTPEALKTADVKFHAGGWWLSVCVEIGARMEAGAEKLKVAFDLIDGFASVMDANGRCAPGLSDPFSSGRMGEFANKTEALQEGPCGEPRFAGEAQADPQQQRFQKACGEPRFAGEAQDNRIANAIATACGEPRFAGEAQAAAARQACGEPRSAASHQDAIQSQCDRRFKRGSIRWRREKDRLAKIKAREARQRREALHRWSTAIIRMASDLTVIAPPVNDMRSGRGTEHNPGAQVEAIAMLNRAVRSKAPASAIQMLSYKAAEAAIRCDVVKAEDHEVQIGGELRAAAIVARKARRIAKRKTREQKDAA